MGLTLKKVASYLYAFPSFLLLSSLRPFINVDIVTLVAFWDGKEIEMLDDWYKILQNSLLNEKKSDRTHLDCLIYIPDKSLSFSISGLHRVKLRAEHVMP